MVPLLNFVILILRVKIHNITLFLGFVRKHRKNGQKLAVARNGNIVVQRDLDILIQRVEKHGIKWFPNLEYALHIELYVASEKYEKT